MKKGFTLIEILTAIGIFSIIFFLSSIAFTQIQRFWLFSDTLWQLVATIRESQSRVMTGEFYQNQRLFFGVLFKENSYQQFATTGNFSNRLQNYDLITLLPKDMRFTNFNLPQSCFEVHDCLIFSFPQGTVSAEGSIELEDLFNGRKKVLTINKEGRILF